MAIDEPLYVTPPFTMSTIQFKSETLNVIATSIIAVFILVNIGSAVSKLVYFQWNKRFSYASWLRAFIFANSDDPLRIFAWLFRRYEYRERHWLRAKNDLCKRRLVIPLLARSFVFLASIASIAITIPRDKKLSGCRRGDFKLGMDVEQAKFTQEQVSVCTDIPLRSELGNVQSTASYCACPLFSERDALDPGVVAISARKIEEGGFMYLLVFSRDENYGFVSYVEWKTKEREDYTYRSDVSDVQLDEMLDVAVKGTLDTYENCVEGGRVDANNEETGLEVREVVLTNCFVSPNYLSIRLESYMRNAFTLTKMDGFQRRIRVKKADATGGFTKANDEDECQLDVVVTRPVVNIVPLLITLLLWCIVNIVVSRYVNHHGNALDAGFHIVKEALGHDCTSNPLEQNRARNEIMEVELTKWLCKSSGGGHVGFIGREGDVPVEEFPDNTVVGGCNKAAIELAGAKVLAQSAPTSPSSTVNAPGMSGGTTPAQSMGGVGAGVYVSGVGYAHGVAPSTPGVPSTPGAPSTPGGVAPSTPGGAGVPPSTPGGAGVPPATPGGMAPGGGVWGTGSPGHAFLPPTHYQGPGV